MPKNVCHSAMHPRFPFSSLFSFTLGILGSSWSFSCVFHSTFLVVGFIFPWMGGRFCSAGDWAVFLTFWELLVHFPFTFFAVSPTIGLTHRLFGAFFPAVSCAH